MLQLRKAWVDGREQLEMMPVDLLASAIVHLSFKPTAHSYNLHNQHAINWHDYLALAKNRGYSIDLLASENEWSDLLNGLDEKNALFKLSHLYKSQTNDNTDLHSHEGIAPDYVIATPSYKEMIDGQITSLIKDGFLLEPTG